MLSEPPLKRLSDQQSLAVYLREAWDRRAFAIVVPRQEMRSQNMDTALGQFWHVLNPALLVAVYYVIFGVVLDASRGVEPYLGFLVIGIVLFQLTQRVAQDGAAVISRNDGLIRSIQFPRVLLPISVVHAQTFAFVPALFVVVATLLVLGVVPTVRWFLFPLVLIAQYGLNLGAALLTARWGASIRDLSQLLPHLFRLLFYASGVLFSIDQFVSEGALRDLFALNPIYGIISCARWCLISTPVDSLVVFATASWCLLAPVVGLLVFRRAEHRFGV
jgi:teichoic acid transport system permease protein